MILHTPRNGSYFDENNISLGWQKIKIFGASLEFSVRPQRVIDLDPWYKLVCYLNI